MKNMIIINNSPSKALMQRVHAERKQMVIAFMVKPDCVVDHKTAEAFQTGWLKGLGLRPSHRLTLVLIPDWLNFGQAKRAYLEQFKDIGNLAMQPWLTKTLNIKDIAP